MQTFWENEIEICPERIVYLYLECLPPRGYLQHNWLNFTPQTTAGYCDATADILTHNC